MILKLLREGLGRLVIFIDWLTKPKMMQREPGHQAQVNAATQGMLLYQFYACPFCIKTRRAMHRLNLPIETRNASIGSPYRAELEQGGGRIQVPCLYLEQDGEPLWMYESGEIIDYLEGRFGAQSVSEPT